jgi:hypothetical protein
VISVRVPPKPRDIFWVPIEGVYSTDNRCSVITRVETDYVELIYGQSVHHCPKDVTVLQKSIDGIRMGLIKDTHFRCMNVLMVKRTYLPRVVPKACTLELFLRLEALAIEQRRQGTIGWQPPLPDPADITPALIP